MGKVSLPGLTTLKTRSDFDRVLCAGQRFSRSGLGFYFRESCLDGFRYGLMVSRKRGNAVERNLFRRRLREVLRCRLTLPTGVDLVVCVGRPCCEFGFVQIEKILQWAMEKISVRLINRTKAVSDGFGDPPC